MKYSAAQAAAMVIGLELPVPKGVDVAPEPDSWVEAVCRHCAAECGVSIAVTDGRVVTIKGSTGNLGKGLLCMKGFYTFSKAPEFKRVTRKMEKT